jgi:hypothetical protein
MARNSCVFFVLRCTSTRGPEAWEMPREAQLVLSNTWAVSLKRHLRAGVLATSCCQLGGQGRGCVHVKYLGDCVCPSKKAWLDEVGSLKARMRW